MCRVAQFQTNTRERPDEGKMYKASIEDSLPRAVGVVLANSAPSDGFAAFGIAMSHPSEAV